MINGGFAYGYLFMSQHPETPKVFKTFLESVRPARILEIGSFHGGLTLLLRDIMDELKLQDNPIRTYDIHDQEFLKPLVKDRNVDVITKNLFNDTYTNWASELCNKEIYNYINQNGTSIVLCDGGCKKCEFNLIAPLLKINDIIMAHDYAPNSEYFEKHIKNKIWNWHEIQDSDIEHTLLSCPLRSYDQDILQNIAWCCKIKTSS